MGQARWIQPISDFSILFSGCMIFPALERRAIEMLIEYDGRSGSRLEIFVAKIYLQLGDCSLTKLVDRNLNQAAAFSHNSA